MLVGVRIAAVVLHHETPAETRACLASLRASRRPLDQIVVVDNGSRDGSAAALAAPEVTLVRAEQNLGFAGGCNLGVRRALDDGAELLLLVNSDAALAPDCLGALEAALRDRPALGIVAPALVRPGPPPRLESLGIRFSPRTGRMRHLADGALDGARPRGLIDVDGVSGACALVRGAVFAEVGRFAVEYFYGYEDLDFCLRAARAGFGCACLPSATAWHLGARTIGAGSARRLYFGARNQLLLASRAAPLRPAASALRALGVVALNLAHAIVRAPAPRWAGLRAVARGVRDHVRGRYGAD